MNKKKQSTQVSKIKALSKTELNFETRKRSARKGTKSEREFSKTKQICIICGSELPAQPFWDAQNPKVKNKNKKEFEAFS